MEKEKVFTGIAVTEQFQSSQWYSKAPTTTVVRRYPFT